VQSLDLSNPTAWQSLPDLPSDAQLAAFVRDGDDLVLVNPTYKNLLRFNVADRTFAVVEGQTLPIVGGGVSMLDISDSMINGCV
jgi:hypothetical protein